MDLIPAKTIITHKKDKSWFGTEYNMNIYKGCCHKCIYCDSRSDCYKIDNFDIVRAKENALEIIRNDLRRKVKKGTIATGSMSDPYNIYEKELKFTRNSLELINAYEFGVAISTKSSLITRDIDILKDIKQHSPVCVKITITCCDDKVSNIIESNVSLSSERFEAIKKLSSEGIFTGILLMPVLPFITDSKENILNIVKMAYEANAKFIYPYFGITLRQGQREYFYTKLEQNYEGLKEKYIKTYKNQYSCLIPDIKKKYYLFEEECKKFGILYKMKDIIRAYNMEYEDKQLKLF